jgi:hypothetical protein
LFEDFNELETHHTVTYIKGEFLVAFSDSNYRDVSGPAGRKARPRLSPAQEGPNHYTVMIAALIITL